MATIGGRSLGTATGSIKIDTSDLEQAGVTVKRVARDIKTSIGGGLESAGKSVDQLSNKFKGLGSQLGRFGGDFKRLGNSINGLRGELLGVGLAGAGITAIGVKAAASIEGITIQLKGMVGTEEEAVALMDSLREQSAAAGIPFADMLQAAKQLLPTLEGSTDELKSWLPLVKRVAVLNQGEGVAGAAFALNEAISSGGTDLVSLTERFSISRVKLREALEETNGDFAAALDIVLTKMGITNEAAEEMGTSFTSSLNAAKDVAIQLAAAGFTPILEVLTPILRGTADWLNKLRETQPAIAKIGAGLAAFVAVGAPALVIFGQMLTTFEKMQKLGIIAQLAKLGPGAAVVGGFGLAAAGGVGAGIGASRAIGRATGNEELANADTKLLWTEIKQILFVAVAGISEVITRVGTTLSQLRYIFAEAITGMVNAIANFIRTIGNALPDSMGGDQLNSLADGLDQFIEGRKKAELEYMAGLKPGQEAFLQGALKFLGLSSEAAAAVSSPSGGTNGDGGGDSFNAEQTAAITQFYDNMRAIEDNGNTQRLQTEQEYQDSRTDVITEYNRSNLREEQDFARSRRRQAEQFNRDLAAIAEERVQREAAWLEDLNESIANLQIESGSRVAEMQEEGNARIEEIEEDYNARREQAAREHQDTLLNAASRLDAGAIAAEQRRYATQTATAQSEFQKRISDEKSGLAQRIKQEQENLAARIAQEQEAHVIRITEARLADEERIADMREAMALQQRLEDEDRALRLQRAREDHARQLSEMQEANRERLAEISRQTLQEKDALRKKFQDELASLGIASEAYLNEQKAKQDESLALFSEYWGDWKKVMEDAPTGNGSNSANMSFASGGAVDYTGSARVHGSSARPEYMLNADTTAKLRSMLGSFNQASIVAAVGGRGGGMNIGGINMPIYAAAGQSPQDIATAVERQLIGLFRSMS